MNLENLREKLKDAWADFLSKIQENSTFNNLREQFESQSPNSQKLILAGGCTLLLLLVLWTPWGYISSSQDNMAAFEENRTLIQGLLKAARIAKEPSPLPPGQGAEILKSQVQNILKENQLLPDQIGEIQSLGDRPAKDMAPTVVTQAGISIPLQRLTLNQIIAVSHGLQSMGAGTKLMGMDVTQSAAQTHFYDVVLRLVQFSLPTVAQDSPPSFAPRPGAKGGKRPSAPSETEGDE